MIELLVVIITWYVWGQGSAALLAAVLLALHLVGVGVVRLVAS